MGGRMDLMGERNEGITSDEERLSVDECKRRVDKACADTVRRTRRELRESIASELSEMGELAAALRLILGDLVKAPRIAFGMRDQAENLRNELESATKMVEEGMKTEPKVAGSSAVQELESKIQLARATIDDLDVTIKHFDRLEKEISVKIETLVSRRKIKALAAFVGGFMIFVGATTLTGALLLALAPGDLPFLYSMFDEFFNYLLMLLGGILIVSGFLHQV